MSDQPIPDAEAQAQTEGDVAKSTLPEKRSFVLNRPGHINFSDGRASAVGSKLTRFDNTNQLNAFFRDNANLLVVALWPSNDHIDCLYTNVLDKEEQEEMMEFQREWAVKSEEREKAKAKARRDAEAAKQKAEADVRELVGVGRNCKEHHAKLIDKMKELEKEVKKLKRGK